MKSYCRIDNYHHYYTNLCTSESGTYAYISTFNLRLTLICGLCTSPWPHLSWFSVVQYIHTIQLYLRYQVTGCQLTASTVRGIVYATCEIIQRGSVIITAISITFKGKNKTIIYCELSELKFYVVILCAILLFEVFNVDYSFLYVMNNCWWEAKRF